MKYNYASANWTEFTLRLEIADYSVIDTKQPLENQYECFRTIILEAADTAIPKKIID